MLSWEVDKHIAVDSREIRSPPKVNLMCEVEHICAVIIKPTLILVTHTGDFSRLKIPNQLGQSLV